MYNKKVSVTKIQTVDTKTLYAQSKCNWPTNNLTQTIEPQNLLYFEWYNI